MANDSTAKNSLQQFHKLAPNPAANLSSIKVGKNQAHISSPAIWSTVPLLIIHHQQFRCQQFIANKCKIYPTIQLATNPWAITSPPQFDANNCKIWPEILLPTFGRQQLPNHDHCQQLRYNANNSASDNYKICPTIQLSAIPLLTIRRQQLPAMTNNAIANNCKISPTIVKYDQQFVTNHRKIYPTIQLSAIPLQTIRRQQLPAMTNNAIANNCKISLAIVKYVQQDDCQQFPQQ